ncbi:MAG TPA: aminodeoxychorismate/anthranilate synthase component II [Candidatus Altiarchaeales archaeon]|nr:aminodeoxychorismate/anthranilate synthase component II [Candidatus Altiarchaeales archaeon]
MRVLVIDNIDSFVYNLVQYLGILKAEVKVVQNTISEKNLDGIIKDADAIVLSPGPGKPSDAKATNYAIRKYGGLKPILGVCLGHQAIAEQYGGVVTYAGKLMHGKTCMIKHDNSELFKNVANPFEATRYHSLAVERESLPDCLEVTAESVDDGEIMAIKHKEYRVYGVQFHPESILTKEGLKIMKNFLEVSK